MFFFCFRKCSIWTIRWYLFFLCLIVLCQSMITSGYIGSILSSIESYYGFSTEELGIAFSSYDIVGVISIPLISYIGSKCNRPKIVACGAFLFSIGNLIFILPYLINGYNEDSLNNTTNETTNYFCKENNSSIDSLNIISSKSIFNYFLPNYLNNEIKNEFIPSQPKWCYYTFILSMIIMSIGASPFYTLGITFLTDHLNKDDQPIYTSKSHFYLFYFIFILKIRFSKKYLSKKYLFFFLTKNITENVFFKIVLNKIKEEVVFL